MRRRSEAGAVSPANRTELTVKHDPVNEQIIIASTIASLLSDDPSVGNRLLDKYAPDVFQDPQHQAWWTAARLMRQRKLSYDPATLQTLIGNDVKLQYFDDLADQRGEVASNLGYHEDALVWDHKRIVAVKGPVAALLEALQNPRETPERIRTLARSVSTSLDHGETQYIYDARAIVAEQMAEIRKRIEGHAVYPFGIKGLDFHETGDKRMVPGAAPGQITVVTGVPGSGKSTLAAHMALGLGLRGHRRVTYGAWEVKGPMTLESMACIHLGWSRTDILDPEGAIKRGRPLTHERLVKLEEAMHEITRWVTFVKNPFRRGRERSKKGGNEANLDLVQSLISDTACEVFIADLWARCLVSRKPEEEEEALFRQQSMLEEMGVHGIIVHQQRHKDIEMRSDKRPTREGLKGSGAYLETADNMIGVHRPAQWRRIEDILLEAFILKQRFGVWPIGVEFDWNPEKGSIEGGRSIEYDPMGEAAASIGLGFTAVNQGDESQVSMGRRRRGARAR